MIDASRVELTLLDPTCTRSDAAAVLESAVSQGYGAVCLPPTLFPLRGAPEELRLVSVAGYPTGKHHPLVKGSEARMAVANGAHEVHVVLDAANVVAGGTGDLNALISEIVMLRESVTHPAGLQVGVGSLELNDEQIATFCRAAVTAGADMVVAGSVSQATRMLAEVGGSPVLVKLPGVGERATVEDAAGAGVHRVGVTAEAVAGPGATGPGATGPAKD